jgi:lipoprotein-anchoring transpeptidase ErfK/SrfK
VHFGSIWSHWSGRVGAVVFTVLVGAGVAVGMNSTSRSPASTAAVSERRVAVVVPASARAALAASLTFTPARGATNVALNAPVAVATRSNGYLTGVQVTGANGASIPGAFAPSNASWWSQSPLQPGQTYRITTTVRDATGVSTTVTSNFTTLVPATTLHADLFPHEGLNVGVGQPIKVRFDRPVTDPAARASLLQHLDITATKPVAGGWHWFNNGELHFRPKTYWPSGDQVTVTADLDGWSGGDGMWGAGTQVTHFTVGDARVSTANLATHTMSVTLNGKVIATWPMSGGRDKYPTMNGTHIVMDRESVVRMNSATNGIPVNSPDGYDELVYDDVHISDSGEYVHAAPWSVGSQGRANVSHGCINLSPDNAHSFFEFSRVGDIVVVTGGPRQPELGDHGVMDWDTPSAQWTPAMAHAPASAPAATTTTTTTPPHTL